MEKRKQTIKWVIPAVLLLFLTGIVILVRQTGSFGYSDRQISGVEAANEMEAVSSVRPDLGNGALTYVEVEELLEQIHLEEYITYEKKTGARRITRKDWHEIYEQILDYLEAGERIRKEELLVLGIDESADQVFTSGGTYQAKGNHLEEFQSYTFYVSGRDLLGIVEKKEGEAVLSNAFLKSIEDQTAEILFDQREYSLHTGGDADMAEIVCDLVFEDGKIREIRKKEETIEGNLITLDEKEIEIEGYGKIPLAERVPVYKRYGTLEEKTLKDIVIGNMNVQYVVGQGSVQAVLLKEPADIRNIRVLLLNGSSPYYENIWLNADGPITVQTGERSEERAAGSLLAAGELLADADSCRVTGADGGKIYLAGGDGTRTSLGYPGTLELRKADGGYTVVNEVSFEVYICGILPSEMPEKFGFEALKAQAVCARTYAYMQLMRGDYAALGAHIDDSTNYQVYNKQEGGEKSKRAVEDTSGLVLKYQGNVIESYYYSTSCGHTGTMEDWNENEEEYPYLVNLWVKETQDGSDLSKEKNFRKYITQADDACYDGKVPYFRWTASLDFNGKDEAVRSILTEAKNKESKNITCYMGDEGNPKDTLEGFGAVTEVSVQKRGKSGAVKILKVTFENGTALVTNEYNIRKVLGAAMTELTCQDGSKKTDMNVLPSAYAIIDYSVEDKKASVLGGGFGHGIGMSQYGADGMAGAGKSYEEILTFFYRGVGIESMY